MIPYRKAAQAIAFVFSAAGRCSRSGLLPDEGVRRVQASTVKAQPFRQAAFPKGLDLRRKFCRGVALTLAVVIGLSAPALAKIHPGDRVAVLVYNHPELSGQATVDGTGRISLPLAGGIDTTNLDPGQVAQRVQYQLRPYVRKPAVDVQLFSQAQSLFVAGGPGGVLPYTPGENLSSALAQLRTQVAPVVNAQPQQVASNDFDRGRVDLEHISVMRDGSVIGTFDMSGNSADSGGVTLLQSGDTIELRNKPIAVRVRGEVRTPGLAYLSPSDTLSTAITQVGGDLPTSAANNITLQRGGVTHVVAFGSPEFSQPAQPGDVIVVPRAPTVNVVGMVVKPGDVQLKTDSTLLSALYGADGIQKWADLKKVQVLRHGQPTTYDVTRLTHGDVSQNPQLADGDTVFVPEGHKIDWTPVFAGLGLALGFGGRFIPQRVTP
jgi:polysaccharide export outer membrane protein